MVYNIVERFYLFISTLLLPKASRVYPVWNVAGHKKTAFSIARDDELHGIVKETLLCAGDAWKMVFRFSVVGLAGDGLETRPSNYVAL